MTCFKTPSTLCGRSYLAAGNIIRALYVSITAWHLEHFLPKPYWDHYSTKREHEIWKGLIHPVRTICYPTAHWTRPLLSDKLVVRTADREAEEKWREGGVAAKLNGISHSVAAGWKGGAGEEGDSFQSFTPLIGKTVEKAV